MTSIYQPLARPTGGAPTATPATPKIEGAIDRLTRYEWRKYASYADPKQLRALEEQVATGPAFAEHVFATLYGTPPEHDPARKPRAEDQWAYEALESLGEDTGYQRLMGTCRGRRARAGDAALHLAAELIKAFPPPPQQNPQDYRDKIMERKVRIDILKGVDTEDARSKIEELLKEVEEAKVEGKKAAEEWVEWGTQVRNGLDGVHPDPKGGVEYGPGGAIQRATDAVDQADAAMDILGGGGAGGGAGQVTATDPAIRAELARRVAASSKLQMLLKLAGRMRKIAQRKRRTKSKARGQLSGITHSDDVSRAIPSELALLASPATKPLFLKKFVEKTLTVFDTKSTEDKGRGPVVMLLDVSGSMGGNLDIWTKALMLATMHVCFEGKRALHVVHFDSRITSQHRFDGKTVDPAKVLDCAEHFSGGGTNFELPLMRALEVITSDENMKRADVLFITDGEAAISDRLKGRWAAAKAKHEFACYSILLGGSHYCESQLEQLSDKLLKVKDIREEMSVDTVYDLFAEL